MRTLRIYEVGEEVLIKARVSQVYIEKDRVSYTLTDEHNVPYKNRFSMKNIVPIDGNTTVDLEEEEK